MTSYEAPSSEGNDLMELCQDADVSVEHVMTIYNHLHHQQPVVNLQTAMRILDLSEDSTRRVFRLASLAFECYETPGTLYHVPDFARSISETLLVDPFEVAIHWTEGMGELRDELTNLFDGAYRGKELKFQLEENQRRWKHRMPEPIWTVFMILVVAETRFEESVSPARFTIKKARTQEAT